MRTVTPLAVVAALLLAPASQAEPAPLAKDLAADLADVKGKLVGLAEAIPADQYGWAPAEGVRTVSQALMHVAGGNYFFVNFLGGEVPAGVDPRGLESITDPAEVKKQLAASFDTLSALIGNASEERLAETVDMFGRQATIAGAMHSAVSHGHEHLGQMIAYARSVGVTPPWSL
ncbi:MAG: DinB family protein [Thermoanaerobaculia bacterium]|nr:DinB family protein [Thermoanaerobaculia bacterium]